MTTIAGVDIGGTKIGATVLDAEGDPIATTRVPTDAASAVGVHESTKRALQELLEVGQVGHFDAIGVGIAGLVDQRNGTVSHAVNLGIGDEPLPIAELLAHDFRTAVYVENDVNAAALGAYQRLFASGNVHDLAYLSIGTGIAAGVVLGGRLHRGRRGVAGEIGHFPITTDGPTCECGLAGCLEAVASGGAIERLWPVGGDDGAAGKPFAAADLFAAAGAGDERAASLVVMLGSHLASAVYLLVLAYDVDRVVIGGGVSQAGPPFFEAVAAGIEQLGEKSPFVRALALVDRVCPSPEGPIGAIGAAAAAAQRMGNDAASNRQEQR